MAPSAARGRERTSMDPRTKCVAVRSPRGAKVTEIDWADGHKGRYPHEILRGYCPCAGCQGERDLLGRTLMPIVATTYDGPITAKGAELVGNYAMRIDWIDGHSAGIYTFRYLRELGEILSGGGEPPIHKTAGLPR